MGLPSSLLLGVPIPEEYHAAGNALQEAVEQAIKESFDNGVYKTGKAVTPWLLQRVAELTKGNSVESSESLTTPAQIALLIRACYADKALILNNVRVGGEISKELSKVMSEWQV